jgi:hypothetical protein
VAKKFNILWNLIRKLDIININYKPIINPLKAHYEAHYEARKITIGFSGLRPQKLDPNRIETGQFGPVLVCFGSLFFIF